MIKVTFTDEIEIITSTEHLYQWDVGQVLEIDGLNVGTPTIHFGVKGDVTGYAVQSQIVDGKLRCGIPDSVLQSGKQIIAYIYVSAGASKYTDRVVLIPVVERNKPSNYRTVNMDEVTETQSFLDSMVERLTSLEKRVPISFWAGTQAEYNEVGQKQNNCLYIITDDYTVPIESEEHKGCFYRVVGNEIEWINPPMITGVEYRTTERVGGRPVYVKRISLTTAYAGEYVDIELFSGQLQEFSVYDIRGCLYIEDGDTTQAYYSLPAIDTDGKIALVSSIQTISDQSYECTWYLRVDTLATWAQLRIAHITVKYDKN